MQLLRRFGRLGALVTMLAASLLVAGTASATTPSATPLSTAWGVWQDCGSSYPGQNCANVYTTADNSTSHTLFLGGNFTRAIDPSSNGSATYQNLVAVNDQTGTLVTSFGAHTFNGTIYALAVDVSANLLYVGGDFTLVDGSSLAGDHLAAFNMSTGALSATFNAQPNGSVRSLVYDGVTGLLYLGGRFTAVQGSSRGRLAAVNPVTGLLSTAFLPPVLSWIETSGASAAEARTLTIGADAAGRRMLYVGGHFDTVNGTAQQSLLRVDAATGALDTTFRPHVDASADDPLQAVDKIVWFDGSQDGRAGIVVGQAGHYNRAYRFDLAGNRTWTLKPNGDVQAVALYSGVIYLGGHFRCVAAGDAQSSCTTNTGTFATRVHLAAVSVTTGAIQSGFAPQMNPKTQPYYFGVWNLRVISGGTLWAAGAFKAVTYGGTSWNRPKLAAFHL